MRRREFLIVTVGGAAMVLLPSWASADAAAPERLTAGTNRAARRLTGSVGTGCARGADEVSPEALLRFADR